MTSPERVPERLIENLIASICPEAGIALSTLCAGWVLRLARAGRVCHVYGYQFELNSAAAAAIAHDKHATSTLLAHAGIPAVPHALFAAGADAAMAAYLKAHRGDLVCKPNLASGGDSVSRVRDSGELSARTGALFARGHRAICLSPYLEIADEVRVVMLDHHPLLLYRKQRPEVLGDGNHSLAGLVARAHPDLALTHPDLLPEPALAERIPAAGERVLLGWQHNLARGARAEDVDQADAPRLIALAAQATRALHLRLAAVDIVRSAGSAQRAAGALRPGGESVLEVNPGIMLERFARQGAKETTLARDVYRRIVDAMMAEP